MRSRSKPDLYALVSLNSVVHYYVASELMHLAQNGRNFKYGTASLKNVKSISALNINAGISLYLIVLCRWYLIYVSRGRTSATQTVFHVGDNEAKFNYATVNRLL